MISINYPEMFTTSQTNLVRDREAPYSNMKLLLTSWKNSLIGDPYFGTNLKKFIYNQNNTVLRDLVIDDIYVSILTFLPQVIIKRNDIKVESDGADVFTTISCINKLDSIVNTYNIKLTEEEQK